MVVLPFRGTLTSWNPISAEEEPQALAQAMGRLTGKQHGQKGPGNPSGHEVEYGPGMRPWDKEG